MAPAGRSFGSDTLTFRGGKTRANNVTTALSTGGQVSFMATTAVDVLLDVTGYFAIAGGWHVAASSPLQRSGSIDYYGFPYAMQASIPGGSLQVYSANGASGNPNACVPANTGNIETTRPPPQRVQVLSVTP